MATRIGVRALAIVTLLAAACGPSGTGGPATSTAAVAVATSAAPSPTKAAAKYVQLGTIDLPTQTTSFDFAAVDPATKTLYLADRTNKGVDVITNEKYVKTITGFIGLKGSDDSGPNGVLLIPEAKQLWATDGDSTVKVIDLTTGTVTKTIALGGTKRGDDLAYDPQDKLVLVGSDAEPTPFLSMISATDFKIVGKLEFPGAGGIEGIEWSASRGVFYVAIPSTKANPTGEIALLDPKAMKVTTSYPTKDCYPHGLAFGPSQRLLVGCSGDAIGAGLKAQTLVLDLTNGSIVASIPEAGGNDIVAYDAKRNVYFVAESNMTADGTKAGAPAPQLGIIDAATNKFLQSFPTLKSAHAVAVDETTGHVYVPIPGKGIAIFGPAN